MRKVSIKREKISRLAGTALSMCLALGMVPAAQAAISGPLAKSVAKGKDIFIHDTFGGRGATCQTCHKAAGMGPTVLPNGKKFPSLASAATVFPHYDARAGKVITLEDKIHGCVAGALGGKPPAYGSTAMRSLVSYLTSLSQGKPINMGGARN